MDTKKLYLLGYGVLAIISLVVVGVLVYRAYNFDLRTRQSAPTEVYLQQAKVDLRVDFGNNKTATYSAEVIKEGPTVLDLIEQVSSDNKDFNVVLEEKPLGTLLKSINGLIAENGYFWFVYVNESLVPGSLGYQQLTNGANVTIRYQKL